MIPVSREISDLKGEFEGGTSFAIDFYVILRKAANKLLGNANPETLKRTVPIYGGLTRNLQVYYCPADVEVPVRLYSKDADVYFDYMPPAAFYARQNFVQASRNKFTIEYVNGVRFIVVYRPSSDLTLVLSEADDLTGWEGVTLDLNSYNTLPGSTSSLQGTFSDTDYEIARDFDTAQDISDYLNGVAIVPLYFDDANILDYVKFRLIENDSVAATGLLTSTGVNVADAETVTVGTQAYRFKDTMALAYDVKRGADAAASLANLKAAINASGTAGTEYFAGTLAHPTVEAGALSATTLALEARTEGDAGNLIATTETSTVLSFAHATLTGGDDGDYYEMTSTQDSVGDYLRDGQNFVRFWLANATTVGTPNNANILRMEADVKMTTGGSQTVIIGKLTLQKSNLFSLEYYSRYMFVSPTSGAWSDTPATGFQINLDRDTIGIFHYEACLLICQAAAVNQASAEKSGFATDLAREYGQYFDRHPSAEQPLSYSILPDIPYTIDPLGTTLADFGERIGEDSGSEMTPTVLFVDDETPAGLINGLNAVYTLAYAPNPGESLVLVLNGVVSQNANVLGPYTYTLSGRTITFSAPIDAMYAGLLTASYRRTQF